MAWIARRNTLKRPIVGRFYRSKLVALTSRLARRSGVGRSLVGWALTAVVGGCVHVPSNFGSVSSYHEPPAPHLRGAGAEPDGERRADASISGPTATAISLRGLLTYADQHSPILLVARSTRSRTEAARIAASLWLTSNPEITVAAGPRFGIAATGFDLELGLTQQLLIVGERSVRLNAANRLRELTDAEIEQLRWAVHCDVHAAFHRAIIEGERVRLAERTLTFQQEVLRVVERQIATGESAQLGLRLSRAEVAQARQVLVATQQALLAARIRLAQFAGWPVSRPPEPIGSTEAPRDPPPDDRLVMLAREAMPGLRTAAARVREADARVAVADREGWPRPSIGVQYRREGNPTSEGPYDIVMGVISVPLPTFQTNQGERARARADAQIARAELDAAQNLLAGQIAEARSEMAAAARRSREYAAEVLPRFEENLAMLRRSFELGEIDVLALAAGRERLLRIQSDALSAQLEYFVAWAGLERVVGMDLWNDEHHEGNAP